MSYGINMNTRRMMAEKFNNIRALASAIKKQQEAFSEGMGKRKLIDMGGDILKALFPGWGHAADFFAEDFIGKRIGIGDEEEIEKYQTPWTGIGYAKEFGKMQEEATPSLFENLLGQGLDYLGTEAGSKFIEGFAKHGGRVPKYYAGGSVLDDNKSPSIVDYFSQQGKTLGGSDKESIAKRLKRI